VTSTAEILRAVVADDAGGRTFPQRLCDHCADALPIKGAGLALMNDAGHQAVIATSDGVAQAMEDLQFALGEGPSVDASSQRRPVLQPDLGPTAYAIWPRFVPAAHQVGIAAIFSFPLQVGAIRLGILDLYREAPGPLSPSELAEALAYADAAVVILLHLQGQMNPAQGLHPQLGGPVERHAEVHQATGMIAVQAAVGLAEALLLLRGHAYGEDRPILQIAKEVLAGKLRFHLDGRDHE
jgi:hypothetical protein